MAVTDNKSVGIVRTQYFTFGQPPDAMALESGEQLGPVTLAYETYGLLNEDRSNAVLILHALSGDAHAAGFHAGEETPGWWDNMIGPGKAFDTDKYCVICSNIIGGCKGSTGPSSPNPRSQRPYGLDFPVVTVRDMVNAQRRLVEHLGIDRLFSVAGGSLGGMQVLEWMTSHADKLRSAIPIATSLSHSPQQIAFHEAGRQAIMADACWNEGDYYDGPQPDSGLAVARMIGHITYMSDRSMTEKFGRRFRDIQNLRKFTPDFEVEGYLQHQGDRFVKRFDANSYLYVTKAIDYFDAVQGRKLGEIFKDLGVKVMVIAFKSDWLYPAYQSQDIVRACKMAGLDVSYCEIESAYGHDAFLLEIEEETHLIQHFLDKVASGESTADYEI